MWRWPSAPTRALTPTQSGITHSLDFPIDVDYDLPPSLDVLIGACRPHSVSGLEHATIRDNIIFAAKYGYDEARYNAVIEACALVRDLEIFEAGDLTGMSKGSASFHRLTVLHRDWREGHHSFWWTKGTSSTRSCAVLTSIRKRSLISIPKLGSRKTLPLVHTARRSVRVFLEVSIERQDLQTAADLLQSICIQRNTLSRMFCVVTLHATEQSSS